MKHKDNHRWVLAHHVISWTRQHPGSSPRFPTDGVLTGGLKGGRGIDLTKDREEENEELEDTNEDQ